MTMFMTTALLITLTASLSGCATYSHEPEPAPTLSPAEQSARADELFTMLDTNGDGYLTRDEMHSGLRYTTQTNAPATRSLMLDKSAPKSEEKKYKHKKLTDEEIAKLVEEAFVKRVDHSVDAVSKEDFKRIVVGPATESQTGNPWNGML